jgi:dTDP-glucose 4,6-dehydratase
LGAAGSLRREAERTVEWYREDEWWWGPIRSGEYREYYERRYGRALSGS